MVGLRLVGGVECLLAEGLPVEISQPNVILNLGWSVQAEPVSRLALQALIDEVGALHGPLLR